MGVLNQNRLTNYHLIAQEIVSKRFIRFTKPKRKSSHDDRFEPKQAYNYHFITQEVVSKRFIRFTKPNKKCSDGSIEPKQAYFSAISLKSFHSNI